jgi:membrane protein CcdC involved in cytochrome C biogenesis
MSSSISCKKGDKKCINRRNIIISSILAIVGVIILFLPALFFPESQTIGDSLTLGIISISSVIISISVSNIIIRLRLAE